MTAYPGLIGLAARHPVVADSVATFVASPHEHGEPFLAALERAAARADGAERDAIEEYLRSDEGVEIGMRAAWASSSLTDVIGAYPLTEPADREQALRLAAWWRDQAQTLADPLARLAAVRIHNGYVRRWTAMV